MNILFIGDIFGEVGRDLIDQYLQEIKQKYQIDFVIANGENTTHGKGLSQDHYNELLALGIDCITMGNHTFDQKNMIDWIDQANCLVRPANLSSYTPGVGTRTFEVKGVKIQVTNLLGRVFYGGIINHPIEVMENIIANSSSDLHVVDFHGDATAEKICFGYEFANDLSLIVGTHTHVQTADERILDGDCAYITDVGMCGPYNQSIGMDKVNVCYRMKTGLPAPNKPGKGPGLLNAVVVNFENNQPIKIERINLSPLNNYIL